MQKDLMEQRCVQKFGDEDPPLKRSRLIVWTMLFGICGLIAWASVSNIDQVTRAQSQVVTSAYTQAVQAPEQGVIIHFHVKEGDSVVRNQLLVTLEKGRAQAAVDDSNAKVAALKIRLLRLQAEVYGRPLVFGNELAQYADFIKNQRDLFLRRKVAINNDIASLKRMLDLVEEEVEMNRKLEETGDVSYSEILKLKRNVADLNAQIENKRNKYFEEAQEEMTKVQEDLNAREEELRDRSQSLGHTELRSPADGIIKNMIITTEGAVVRPGELILEIFPTSSDLIVEAKIKPEDIGFINIGQSASVKLDAYDYSIFGVMKGKIHYISPDTLIEDTQQGPKPYYRVKILIEGRQFKGKNGQDIQIRPGMTATAEIKSADRTVLSYLIKPIAKTLSQSFGER